MARHRISRRLLLQGTAAAAGASAFSTSSLFGGAHAQAVGEKSTLLAIFLQGGYNALFCSADSFVPAGTFGATAANVQDLGNGLVVDRSTFGTMPAVALSRMASIGVRHGSTDHGGAQRMDWTDGSRSYALRLADTLGGDAAIKCAVLGRQNPDGPKPAENGVTMQTISDMGPTIVALGGSQDPTIPDREIAAKGMASAQNLSASALRANPAGLLSMTQGYSASVDTLNKPVKVFNLAEMQAAYGIGTTTAVTNFRNKFAAAELMTLAGANVIIAQDDFNWDSHGDRDGSGVRARMNTQVLPGLNVFLQRMMSDPARNVVTVIFGDFSRSLPGSDHQPNLTATVIGKYVRVGTTGKVSANVGLPPTCPSVPGLWQYLSAALKTNAVFGANPHGLIL